MKRAKRIVELFTKFAENYEHFSEHNDELLVDCEFEKWHEILGVRSQCQRDIFKENEEIIAEAEELMSNPIVSKEEADEILVFYRRFVNQGNFDFRLFKIVYEPLLDFYLKTSDYLRLIGLYVSSGALVSNVFDGGGISAFPISPKECALKAVECSKKVDPLEQTDIWVSTFSAYANLIGTIPSFYRELAPEFMHYFSEAMAYFNDPVFSAAIMATPNGKMFKTLIQGRIIFGEDAYEKLSEPDKKEFAREVNRQINEPDIDYSKVERVLINYGVKFFIGEVDGRLAFEKMLDALIEMDPKFERADVVIQAEDFMEALFLFDFMFKILKRNIFSEEETHERVDLLRSKIKILLSLAPYGYMTEYVNYSCAAFANILTPYLKEEQELINALRSLLILRQPITYIHTLMVRKISVAIAEKMLSEKPELFVPLFGKNTTEVNSRHDEIIDYISKAAMLHDLGKNKIATVINNQYRKITDEEFNLIKRHPNLGPEIFENNNCLEKYYDVMRGHHKTYDGKGGYPADFDNTASPYKIVIDLITIADCTDAATDILGRNYAAGKDFYHLLEELVRDKGTRYNPDIVDMISSSSDLCEELNIITGSGRKRTYYHAYRHVMNLEYV